MERYREPDGANASPGQCPSYAGSRSFPRTLLSDETLRNPFPVYAMLRSERPVAFIPEQNLWIVSRYDDCKFALDHPEKFSSQEAVSSVQLRIDARLKRSKFSNGPRRLPALVH